MTEFERLIFDLKDIANHFHWTATRVGEPGCRVRSEAQYKEQVMQDAIAKLRSAYDPD